MIHTHKKINTVRIFGSNIKYILIFKEHVNIVLYLFQKIEKYTTSFYWHKKKIILKKKEKLE